MKEIKKQTNKKKSNNKNSNIQPTPTSDIKLPDVLENQIIQLILEYLLCGNTNETYNDFIKIKFIDNYNQIFKLAIVSVRWFNRISDVISNNVINSSEHNGIGQWWNYYSYQSNNKCGDSEFNNNKKWSLIKIDQSIIDNFFNSMFVTYNYIPNSIEYLNKNKICLILNTFSDSTTPNKNLDNSIESFKFLFNNRKSLSLLNFKLYNYQVCFKLNVPFELELNEEEEFIPLVFECLTIGDMHLFYGELFEKGLLKCKNLYLQFTDKKDTENNDELLSKICSSDETLKSITIRGNNFNIGSIKHVNLESLRLPIQFNELFNILSTPYSIFIKENQEKLHNWEIMIESLTSSNNNNCKLKRLKLFDYLSFEDSFLPFEYSLNSNAVKTISIGLFKLFQLNKSITFLKLSDFVWISPSTWSGLLFNQSLKSLSLRYYGFLKLISNSTIEFLFSKLFNMVDRDVHVDGNGTTNKSLIRHFKLKTKFEKVESSTLIFENLIKYPNSSLYSIRFAFSLKHHYKLLVKLLSLPNLTISEFNLEVPCGFNITKFFNQPSIKNLKNRKIINFCEDISDF